MKGKDLAHIQNNEALNHFEQKVNTFAKLTKKSPQFIAESIFLANSVGIPPEQAYTACWDMTELGGSQGAILKVSVLQSLFIAKKLLNKPIEVIDDASYLYYYYDLDKEGLKEELAKEYYTKALKAFAAKGKDLPSYEKFFLEVKKANLYKEPTGSPTEVKTKIKQTFSYQIDNENVIQIPERITTLKGTANLPNGTGTVTKTYTYKLSTAVDLGLYFNKSGEIKKAWNDIERMMYKRCSDHLFERLGLDYATLAAIDNEYSLTDSMAEKELEEEGKLQVINVPNNVLKKDEVKDANEE